MKISEATIMLVAANNTLAKLQEGKQGVTGVSDCLLQFARRLDTCIEYMNKAAEITKDSANSLIMKAFMEGDFGNI